MTTEELDRIVDRIQNKEYELGKIVAMADIAEIILELASNAFVVGDDKMAKYLRDLSKGFKEKADTARNFYNDTHKKEGQAAVYELYKNCAK